MRCHFNGKQLIKNVTGELQWLCGLRKVHNANLREFEFNKKA